MTAPRAVPMPRWPAVLAILVLAIVVVGPFLAPWDPAASVAPPWGLPSPAHPLGTDRIGRDVLSRTLHGGWRLVAVTVAALAVAYAVGVPAGLVAGLRRSADGWVMRPVDALVVLPWFLLLAVLATALGRGAPALVAAGALTALPWVVKVVRGAALQEASAGYVEAAVARAEPWRRIAFREVAPNIVPTVAADAGMRLTATLSVVTVGGFLGLGLPPDTPDWALDVAANQAGLTVAPGTVLAPALVIVVLVVAVNLLGDTGMRPGPRPGPARHGAVEDAEGPDALVVRGLRVRAGNGVPLLRDVGLHVGPGEGLAVVGPSGAGKSTLVRAVAGALAPGLDVDGEVRVGSTPGRRRIGWLPQDPAFGLSNGVRIGTQIRDVHRAHGVPTTRDAVLGTLDGVGLPAEQAFARRYPFQLSGGQQQRVLLAMALVGDPALLVLDEPTTGLDPATARVILDVVRARRDAGTALLLVTHDLPSVEGLVDRTVTVVDGAIDGTGAVAQAAAPVPPTRRPASGRPVLEVRGLVARHGRRTVLDGVDLAIAPGECVGLVGVSGAGKSTLARCLVGLHRPEGGEITLDGTRVAGRAAARTVGQRGAVQYVFQNPARSLNPRRSVAEELGAALRTFGSPVRPAELLAGVGLDAGLADRRTDRLSGGQQQRVALARALATRPRVLVCDEIVSSLDPRSRVRILDLLRSLLDDGVAVLFVSHDREAVDQLADRVLVLDDTALQAAPSPSYYPPPASRSTAAGPSSSTQTEQ